MQERIELNVAVALGETVGFASVLGLNGYMILSLIPNITPSRTEYSASLVHMIIIQE
jgi:hypothetical protein